MDTGFRTRALTRLLCLAGVSFLFWLVNRCYSLNDIVVPLGLCESYTLLIAVSEFCNNEKRNLVVIEISKFDEWMKEKMISAMQKHWEQSPVNAATADALIGMIARWGEDFAAKEKVPTVILLRNLHQGSGRSDCWSWVPALKAYYSLHVAPI